MGPHSQANFRFIVDPIEKATFAAAQHVLIKDRALADYLSELADNHPENAPYQLDMPSPNLVVEFPRERDNSRRSLAPTIVIVARESPGGRVLMGILHQDALNGILWCGYITPKAPIGSGFEIHPALITFINEFDRQLLEAFWHRVGAETIARTCTRVIGRALDGLCSLLTEPRLIEKEAFPRAERRRQARVFPEYDTAVRAYSVRWRPSTSGRKTDRPEYDEPSHRKPLHFCRAHWRQYERPTLHSIERPGKPNHWVWVKHAWKGHPDYGIVLHDYVPFLDPTHEPEGV